MATLPIPDIDTIRTLLYNPLFGNRYIGVFTQSIDNGSGVFSDKLGYMINSINLPTNAYNTKEFYAGGINISVPNLFEGGTLDLTIYNTGKEYQSIYNWGEQHYNQKEKYYGYVDDYCAEFIVYEYDRANGVVLEHIFHKCVLWTYGAIQLSYEDAQQVETFQVALKFRTYECKHHKNEGNT